MQAVSDDTLQRTLLLAQKFVDQTKADAEDHARETVSKAEERANAALAEAEAKARSVTQDAERQLHEEVERLESLRSQLAEDVEMISLHLEGERNRLRSSLVEMLTWVDKQVQPASGLLAQSEERSGNADEKPKPTALGNGLNGRAGAHDMNHASTTQLSWPVR